MIYCKVFNLCHNSYEDSSITCTSVVFILTDSKTIAEAESIPREITTLILLSVTNCGESDFEENLQISNI